MEALINYAYSGNLTVNVHNVQSIIMGSNFLQIKEVKDYCCDFIKVGTHIITVPIIQNKISA